MKLQRYSMRSSPTNGPYCDFVKSSDAEALEKRVAELEKALSDRNSEIQSLRLLLSDCLDCFEHTPTRPIAVVVRKVLEAKDE
jgi:hypothetical protein